MKKTLFLIATLCLLSACSWIPVYTVPVQQGNVIDAKEVGQLKIGMTKQQVQFIMSDPVLDSAFNQDRWDYVYTKTEDEKVAPEKRLSLYFSNNKLTRMAGNAANKG